MPGRPLRIVSTVASTYFGSVCHDVIARSDDLEVLEINVPARYGTWPVADADLPTGGAR